MTKKNKTVSSSKKRQLDYGRDIEPLIKKYGLESNYDCKEAIELSKQNNPKGYNQLGMCLFASVKLTRSELRTVLLLFEKSVEMGYEAGYFNLGLMYYLGAGVKRDVVRGFKMIKGAFLNSFSQVFNNYPLGSIESEKLLFVHDRFNDEVMKLLKVGSITSKELEDVLNQLGEIDEVIALVCEKGVSINDIVV